MNTKISTSPLSGATSLTMTSETKESAPQQQQVTTLDSLNPSTTAENEHNKNKNDENKDTLDLPNKILSVAQQQQQEQPKLAAVITIKSNKSEVDSASKCSGAAIVEKEKRTRNSSHVAECDSSSNSNSSSIIGSGSGNSSSCSVNIKRECDENVVIKSENFTEEQQNQSVPPLIENTKSAEIEDLNVNKENVILAKHSAVLLTSVNPHIICFLCKGYLIDATTIVECLHSFCHSCIIKHLLNTEQFCPCCELMINTAKPNIKPDTTLQAIVYKLVPGLYERELMRKRAFYKDRPEEAALATPEQRGEDTEHLIFSPSDYMSLSLEYADIDEHVGTNSDYSELLKPRYLQCPSMYTVALMKKYVHGKFNIDINKFNIDIMYKVKTIVLLDHYTLMDVAYIYTWKRDAPMRFYFRVKESLRPVRIVRKAPVAVVAKKEVLIESAETSGPSAIPDIMTIVHEATASVTANEQLLPVAEIKVEDDTEVCQPSTSQKAKDISSPPQLEDDASTSSWKNNKLKITLVSKSSKEKILQTSPSPSSSTSKSPKSPTTSLQSQSKHVKTVKDRRDSVKADPKEERKVENIKLKIDLSKQNSVTIINMSDPQRREIVKPVKPEKEWKVKNKKDIEGNSKSSASYDSKSKTSNNLTVPPLTIKAERINPLARFSSSTQKSTAPKVVSTISTEEEREKSQFLKSFALAPISSVKIERPPVPATAVSAIDCRRLIDNVKPIIKQSQQTHSAFTSSVASKRKSKEPVKTIAKRPKTSPPLSNTDFKIKLPPNPNNVTRSNPTQGTSKATATNTITTSTTTNSITRSGTTNIANTSSATASAASPTITTTTVSDKPLMPPPPTASSSIMRPPIGLPKKSIAKTSNKFAPPGSLTPHPSYGIQLAAPGNRTPIAKRYQPILPKGARPNPFANIPSEVNKILKDAGTEIKTIGNNTKSSKVYGPKLESTIMGPPPPPPSTSATSSPSSSSFTKPPQPPSQTVSSSHRMNSNKSANSNKPNNTNNFLNLALFNASKSKGNEVPPGCRTPMYSPNSPIYSPSSPQYVSNYTIPTVPTYKYTPKPTNGGSNYLQNVLLSTNSQLSSLFPAPPTKRETPSSPSSSTATKPESHPKRIHSFARSPSPDEDQPENKLKVKSLLTQCNINIPSSLSITITREDSESQSSSALYPKHKSPVNNYIEILKLPDQTSDNNHENKNHSSPSAKKPSLVTLPLIKKEHSDQKSASTSQLMASQKASMISSGGNANRHSSSLSNGSSANKSNVKSHNSDTQASFSKLSSSLNNNAKGSTTDCLTAATSEITSSNQKLMQTSPSTKVHEQQKQLNKKTPSPEKRPSPSSNESKSPKSPNSFAASDAAALAQGSKKFRHILPRQNLTPTEVVPPKVTTANIIGTYSSPSGVAVKVHANKKLSPSKKSPGQSHQSKIQAHSSPSSSSLKTSSIKTLTPPSSPSVTTTNAINKLIPHPSFATMSSLPHAMQAMAAGMPNMASHLGVASSAASQAEFSKFLKDNLVRAQLQAAAASQPNMFCPYASAASAAAAAQMNHFQPSMYNYQHAYIMEQLTRMQRAGNEAFTDYMTKLKSGLDKPPTAEVNESPKHTPKTSQPLNSAASKGSSASKAK